MVTVADGGDDFPERAVFPVGLNSGAGLRENAGRVELKIAFMQRMFVIMDVGMNLE